MFEADLVEPAGQLENEPATPGVLALDLFRRGIFSRKEGPSVFLV